MKRMKSVLSVLLLTLLVLLLSPCNNFLNNLINNNLNPTPTPAPSAAPTTFTVVFDNQTGQRLRVYMDGIFINFVEINQAQPFGNNPPGIHQLSADNFHEGTWGPVTINVAAGQTYTWVIR